MNAFRKKTRKLKKKVSSLQAVVDVVKQRKIFSNDSAIPESTFSGVSEEMMMKWMIQQKKKKNCGPYPLHYERLH